MVFIFGHTGNIRYIFNEEQFLPKLTHWPSKKTFCLTKKCLLFGISKTKTVTAQIIGYVLLKKLKLKLNVIKLVQLFNTNLNTFLHQQLLL